METSMFVAICTTDRLAFCAVLIGIHIGQKERFGFIPVYGMGNALAMPIGIWSSVILAPLVSRSYAFKMAPLTIFFPIFGFLIVVITYTRLRRLLGPQEGLVMPLVLCAYELLGTRRHLLGLSRFQQDFCDELSGSSRLCGDERRHCPIDGYLQTPCHGGRCSAYLALLGVLRTSGFQHPVASSKCAGTCW